MRRREQHRDHREPAIDATAEQRHAERQRLHRLVADLERRQGAVLRQAQDADLDDPFTKALRQIYNDLENQGTAAATALVDALRH